MDEILGKWAFRAEELFKEVVLPYRWYKFNKHSSLTDRYLICAEKKLSCRIIDGRDFHSGGLDLKLQRMQLH